MRVLIYGTSPALCSGYATAIRAVSRGLLARGHESAVFAWNSQFGHMIHYDGVPVYPRGNAVAGDDALHWWARDFGADIVMSVTDPWIMGPDAWREGHSCKVVHWFPCQAAPGSQSLVELSEAADAAFCYSQWGAEVMRRAGASKVRYVPLGVNTRVYRPLDRAECRAELESWSGRPFGDRPVLGMVAANTSTIPIGRKAFDQAFKALREMIDRGLDPILYVHAWQDRAQGGFDLWPIARALGVADRIMFPTGDKLLLGINDATMAVLYNAFDVCLQATCGEGFGLPLLEAQACGTPVVATRHSSMPELTRNGRLVEPAAEVWAFAPMEGWMVIPSPTGIADATFELLARDKAEAERDAAVGVEFAAAYEWDRVLDEHLVPALLHTLDS